MIIDDKGRIFGKINVIDALVVLLILCTIPIFYSGYKIMKKRPEIPNKLNYVIKRSCTNCGYAIFITIEKGKPIPEFYEKICPVCKSKVVLIDNRAKTESKRDYMQEYYKRLLEKEFP